MRVYRVEGLALVELVGVFTGQRVPGGATGPYFPSFKSRSAVAFVFQGV